MAFVVAWVSGSKEITYRDQNGGEFTKTGGSRAWRNNNPGNIIKGSFAEAHGAIGQDSRFAVFPDEIVGREAVITLFKTPNYANLSIRNAFYRYAPPSDGNQTDQYIAGVAQSMGVPHTTIVNTLSHEQLEKLADAIKVQEGWNPGTTSGVAPTADGAVMPMSAPAATASHAAASHPAAAPGGSGLVAKLIQIGGDRTRCTEIIDDAATYMIQVYGYKTLHNACAVTLSLFLRAAGMYLEIERGAGALAKHLRVNRGWTKVEVGQQQAGDVAVCFDNDHSISGADHIYLVVKRIDADEMLIADNQTDHSPHKRYASGRGRTPVEYFLRTPGTVGGIASSALAPDTSVVSMDEPTDHLLVRFTPGGSPL